MAGLSRSKNLSENNLNLKTALQKLYEPGIENDIELFSLSSKISSTIISGPEVLAVDSPLSQIYGIESQKIRVNQGGQLVTLNRTKFNTRYFTFTNDNQVYFSQFNILSGPGEVTFPTYSNNGSVPKVSLIYGGRGYYFQTATGGIYSSDAMEITLTGVRFTGEESGANSLEATVVFEKETYSGSYTQELYNFTPGSLDRYRIKSITITSQGSSYLIPERIKVLEDRSYLLLGAEEAVVLKKQRGTAFASSDAIARTALYKYRVVNADATGFFLYDDEKEKYIFLNRNSSSIIPSDIELKRDDSVRIENLFQFKFAGSTVYLENYGDSYRIGESISGELSGLGGSVQNLINSVRTGIQNTKLPTPATSEENTLGYQYNEFTGRDVVIWQRVIMRDQDYLLDPGPPEARTGLTGAKLKDEVDNFQIVLGGVKKKIPGLFIKVGTDYFRAFSTTDKPFFVQIGTGTANPNLSNNRNKTDTGALSAEGYFNNQWVSHDTQIAQLAQRIDYDSTETNNKLKSKNGAFYYHRTNAPTVRNISIKKGTANSTIYAVPLFKSS